MKYTLALSLLPRVGGKSLRRIAEAFGTAGAFCRAGADAWSQAGLSPEAVRRLADGSALARAESIVEQCRHSGVRILVAGTPEFPEAFAECPDAPSVLYVRGDIDFNDGKWVSIVGTRKATPAGSLATNRVVRDLATLFSDTVIVSGLAFGIDKAAHEAALQYGVKTVAVMAGWVDDIVPRTHYYLARQILRAGGTIVSDMPPGTVIDRRSFLSRNRLVAGLSAATIVVESASRGGSLVTADIASGYHKELFALPGSIGEPMSEGTNMLIRSHKALLYQSAADVADALGWEKSARPLLPQAGLPERLRLALERIPDGSRLELEELAEVWNVPLHEASSLAGQLRAVGAIAVDPYKYYYKT